MRRQWMRRGWQASSEDEQDRVSIMISGRENRLIDAKRKSRSADIARRSGMGRCTEEVFRDCRRREIHFVGQLGDTFVAFDLEMRTQEEEGGGRRRNETNAR